MNAAACTALSKATECHLISDAAFGLLMYRQNKSVALTLTGLAAN